jgi:hypothetical protein
MSEGTEGNLTPIEKPSLMEYLGEWLPFKLPRIPLPQTAKNADKALGKLILSGANLAVARWQRAARIKDAKAEAAVELIQKGSQAIAQGVDAGDNELTERAIVAAIGESVEAQRNRERIAEFASAELERDPGPSDAKADIDDDWLNVFAGHAARVSKEEMQSLWARVLAGEIRQPGTFRLRSLSALSLIDAKEARLVHDHMNLVVEGTALYVGAKIDFVAFHVLLELESIGVIQGVGSSMKLEFDVLPEKPATLRLSGNYAIRIESKTERAVTLNNICALTPFGSELVKLAQADTPREGLPEDVAKNLMEEGLIIHLAALVPTPQPNAFRVHLLRQLQPPPNQGSEF